MIAIVGGGLTGLALGLELARRSLPYLILEASDRPGGVIRSGRVEGHLLEWGPQRTRLIGPVRDLVHDLGVGDRLITATPGLPLLVYHAGKLRTVPFSAAALARGDIVGWWSKLRLLMEPLTAPARPGESVADFLTRKLGRGPYENVVGPLYGGLYGSDPADMLVEVSLGPLLRELGVERSLLLPLLRRRGSLTPPPACSFADGMQVLTDALCAAQQDAVRLGSPVESVRRAGDGYVVEAADEVLHARTVVVTVPARPASRILRATAPEAASRIGGLTYNPLAIVHLHARTDLRGLGYQVAFGEELVTRGVTFNDSLFGRAGVYTAYLGGARSREVVGWSDAAIGETAVREFRLVTGFEATVLAVARQEMPAWDRSWRGLEPLGLPPGLHVAANWQSRPGIPGRLVQAKRLAATLAGGR